MSTGSPKPCRIWQVDLTIKPISSHVLSAAERERAARYHFDRDRARFVAGRVALREILGDLLNRDPACITFVIGAQGRPSLNNDDKLEFNMSHSGDLALIAVSDPGPLGVDIEVLREVPQALDLARRYFHPQELPAIEAVSPEERSKIFLTCWTRKEAVLKSTGVGLTFDTQLLNCGATRDEKELNFPPFPPLRIASLALDAGFAGAIAASPGACLFEFHRYESRKKSFEP